MLTNVPNAFNKERAYFVNKSILLFHNIFPLLSSASTTYSAGNYRDLFDAVYTANNNAYII